MQVSTVSPAVMRRWRPRLAVAGGTAAALVAGYYAASRSLLVTAGAVAGGVAGVWALRRYEVALYGLIAVIALLPFGVVPLRLAVAPTLLDLATTAVFFLWLARVALRRSGTRLTSVGVGSAAFAAALVAAYVFSAESLRPDETARLFAKIVAAHLLFVPVLNLTNRRDLAERLVVWIVVVAALEALVGLALYAAPRTLAYRALSSLAAVGYPTGDSVLRYRPETEILRANGTQVDPNMLGALLMVAAALALPQLLAARPVLPKPLVAACLAPMGLCLLLTESRGSWLGLLGGLLLVGGLRYRRLWIALALVVALALALPQAQRFTGHLTSGLQAQDRASAMRLGEVQNALGIIGRHPWFGAGWAAEGQSIEEEFTLGVSNIYLTIAERAGLPALAIYLATLAALALPLWRGLRAGRMTLRLRSGQAADEKRMGIRPSSFLRPRLSPSDDQTEAADDGLLPGLVAALAATQVAGLVDHHFVRFPHLIALLWVVAALAVIVAEPTRAAATGSGHKVTRAAAPGR